MKDLIVVLFGDWAGEFNLYSCLLRLALSLVLAMMAGSERATKLHAAGLKTFICVSLVAALGAFGDLFLMASGATFSFIVPAIVIGVAIISGNTLLYSSKNQLRELTTSIGLWAVALITVTVCFGLYTVGLVAFILFMLCITLLPKLEKKLKRESKYLELHIELKTKDGLQTFIATIRKIGLLVKGVEPNPAYINSGLSVYSVTLQMGGVMKGKSHKEIVEAISGLEIVNFAEEVY